MHAYTIGVALNPNFMSSLSAVSLQKLFDYNCEKV